MDHREDEMRVVGGVELVAGVVRRHRRDRVRGFGGLGRVVRQIRGVVVAVEDDAVRRRRRADARTRGAESDRERDERQAGDEIARDTAMAGLKSALDRLVRRAAPDVVV